MNITFSDEDLGLITQALHHLADYRIDQSLDARSLGRFEQSQAIQHESNQLRYLAQRMANNKATE